MEEALNKLIEMNIKLTEQISQLTQANTTLNDKICNLTDKIDNMTTYTKTNAENTSKMLNRKRWEHLRKEAYDEYRQMVKEGRRITTYTSGGTSDGYEMAYGSDQFDSFEYDDYDSDTTYDHNGLY